VRSEFTMRKGDCSNYSGVLQLQPHLPSSTDAWSASKLHQQSHGSVPKNPVDHDQLVVAELFYGPKEWREPHTE